MIDPKDLVPLRWPADAAWQTAEMLSLVKASPINCIVAAPDWKLREQAERAGLQVMPLTASELVTVGKLDPKHNGIAALANSKFPRVPAEGKGNEESDTSAASGPTGNPWVDANGWKVVLARAKAPGAVVWVDAPTPKSGAVLRAENYTLAVADSAAYGGRWIVQFDADLAKGLAAKNDTAMVTGHAIHSALHFFEERKRWASYSPVASLGVLSDFEGPNEY